MPFINPKQPGKRYSEDEESLDMRSEATSNPMHSATEFEFSTGLSSAEPGFQEPRYGKRVAFENGTNKMDLEYRNLRSKLSHLKELKRAKDIYPVLNNLKDICDKLYNGYKISVAALERERKHRIESISRNEASIASLRQENKEKSNRRKMKIKKLESENETIKKSTRETSDQLEMIRRNNEMLKEDKESMFRELQEYKKHLELYKTHTSQAAKNLAITYKKKFEEFRTINFNQINVIKELEKELYKYKNPVKYNPNIKVKGINEDVYEHKTENQNSKSEINQNAKEMSKKLLDFFNK